MRRLTFAALMALALAVTSVAPTFAAGGLGPRFNVWGTVNSSSHSEMDGTFQAPYGGHGSVALVLVGSNDGFSWHPTGNTFNLNLVNGQSNYGFKFDLDKDPGHYLYYKVSGGGWDSRNFSRDECGFRVPEAPSSALLLLGALPAAGLIAIKVTGARLHLPSFRRIV
jgi:hypothetical protein